MTNFHKTKSAKVLTILFLVLILLPTPILAQNNNEGLIPDCKADTSRDPSPDCGYNDFLQLIKNVINRLIFLSFPIAAGVFAWAGFKMMTAAGSESKRTEAKNMIVKVFIGFVIILAAWLIVNTILSALLKQEFIDAVPVAK